MWCHLLIGLKKNGKKNFLQKKKSRKVILRGQRIEKWTFGEGRSDKRTVRRRVSKESHPSFLVRLADLLVSFFFSLTLFLSVDFFFFPFSLLSLSLLHKNLPDRQPPDQSAIELESHITSFLSLLLFPARRFFFLFFPCFPSLPIFLFF